MFMKIIYIIIKFKKCTQFNKYEITLKSLSANDYMKKYIKSLNNKNET